MCILAYRVFPTCVRSPVSLQLVAPGEPLAAEDPVTDERPLAGVPAQMGPQVGRLAVHLPAALHVADVLFLLCGIAAVPVRRRCSGKYALAFGSPLSEMLSGVGPQLLTSFPVVIFGKF